MRVPGRTARNGVLQIKECHILQTREFSVLQTDDKFRPQRIPGIGRT
jgi:hypothetical protein